MKFTKMHGAGNDFIIIDITDGSISETDIPALAIRVCDRHTGIGADGLMLVARAEGDADFRLMFYNSDGSLGEMCGNGARCIARYGYEHGYSGITQRIETTAGLVIGERIDESLYRVRLNDPSVTELDRIACADGMEYHCAYLELGDPGIPHAVLIMDSWDEVPENELRRLGSSLRHADAFPKGANVSFVRLIGEDRIKAVTFERGVEDFTLACGTGCGSIVSALTLMGMVSGRNVRVSMPGGELSVALTAENGRVRDILLTGPTAVICEGEYFI